MSLIEARSFRSGFFDPDYFPVDRIIDRLYVNKERVLLIFVFPHCPMRVERLVFVF